MSIERQKGLTTGHLHIQLGPFASTLTIYTFFDPLYNILIPVSVITIIVIQLQLGVFIAASTILQICCSRL